MGCKHSVPTSDLSELPPARKALHSSKSVNSSQGSTVVEKTLTRRGATLFKNATIISHDVTTESLRVLRHASMLIEDGRIAQIYETDAVKVPAGAEAIDATGKIISPGFINTHHHMWQTQLRTLAADTTLQEYFARYGQTGPACKTFTPEDVYLGQTVAALEMIDSGTTTVVDHAHGIFSDAHIDAALTASFESGLRIFHAHAVEQVPTYTLEQSLTKFMSLLNDRRFANDIVKLGLAYDMFAFMPTEVSQQVMRLITEHNNTSTDTPVSLLTSHFVSGPYGCNNTPSHLESFSVLSQSDLVQKLPVILSHASFLSETDATLIRQHPHVSISSTPESEAHFGHTSAGADACQDCASLGCDTHFTFNSYMPFQARLWLQQLRLKEYTATLARNEMPSVNPMAVHDAFLLMTKKGGDALGREDLGVIRVGAQADLVVFDCSRAGMWGCAASDPVASVVLHSGGAGDVEGVMVAGEWVKRDGRILRDVVGIRRRYEESAARIREVWERIDRPVFKEGEMAWGGVARFGRALRVNVRRKSM